MAGISFKQFKRNYSGNYNLNFANALSGAVDFKNKNFTNFYLTNNVKFSDVYDIGADTLKSTSITTSIRFGENYLSYSDIIDPRPYAANNRYSEHLNYRVPIFQTDESKFTIEFLEDNVCNIYILIDYKKFYLAVDDNGDLVFVKHKLLTFTNESINPQDIKYSFSEGVESLLLFKNIEGGSLFITKIGDELKTTPVVTNNSYSYIVRPFTIDRNIYIYPDMPSDTSFITYTNDNNVDVSLSVFDLKNNLLLHRTDTTNLDVIVLKNQLLQSDVFSSCDNLLSGGKFYVDGLRDYSNISKDIDQEGDGELELSYVFFNQEYKIKSGTTIFTSPSSMYPFTKLNINDTKFTNSGAFSHSTPEFADKVCSLSEHPQNYNSDQHLLCTWLSGNSVDSVWVDRYYYPDLISKEAALSGNEFIMPTYDDYVETLIQNNTELREDITIQKIFDKRSDMAFEPNKRYRYQRISIDGLDFPENITYCKSETSDYPINYFEDINEAGKFSLGGSFRGDVDTSWEIKSNRNAIDSGISIKNIGGHIIFTYIIYDPSDGLSYTFTKTEKVKPLKINTFFVSINSFNGECYFFLNDEIIKSFDLIPYQFLIKQILYGDVTINDGNEYDILVYSGNAVSNIFLIAESVASNLAFTVPFALGFGTVNDIFISLPCGMRNSTDNIAILNSICDSTTFKSNNFNIHLKNLNINTDSILDNLKSTIRASLEDNLPVNSVINDIKIENYK
jgi:hypothetical protein